MSSATIDSHNTPSHDSVHDGSDEKLPPAAAPTHDIDHQVNDDGYARGVKLLGIILAVVLSVFLIALDQTIIGTAIPAITDDFRALDDIGWYGSSFFLTLAAFQSTWGKAYTYFDLKIVFLLSLAIFEIGSLICGVAPSSTALIVGRAIAGAGGAGIAAGAYTIVFYSVPPAKAPAYTGLLGATYSVASVIGPLLGGVFTEQVTWRLCFYINLPIGFVSAVIIVFFFKTPTHAKPQQATLREKMLQLDMSGTALLLCSFVCLILALQWGGVTKAWNDSEVIGTFVGFGLILIAFGVNEWYLGNRALFAADIVKSKTLIIMCLFISLVAGAFFTWLYYLPIYFQSIKDASAQSSGIRNLALIVACGLMSVVSGVAITKTGHYHEMMIGGSVLLSVGAGLLYTLDIGTSTGKWIGYQILAGVGIGALFQLPMIVMQNVMADKASRATAIVLFAQTIAGSVWVAAAQSLFTNDLIGYVRRNLPNISPALVTGTGATELRDVFNGRTLTIVLEGYMAGLKKTFLLAVPLAAAGGLLAVLAVVFDYRKLDLTLTHGGAGDDGEGEKHGEDAHSATRGSALDKAMI